MPIKPWLYALATLVFIACLAKLGHAQEFRGDRHYVVSFLACDRTNHCERMKRPIDADNEVHCVLKAGMVGAVQWLSEHPGWRLIEAHCAAEGEADL